MKHFQTQGNPKEIDLEFEKYITKILKEEEKSLNSEAIENPITISEIKEIIKKLKQKKSPGPDLICYEIIKHSSEVMLLSLAKYFNLIFETTYYPTKWDKSFIIPIYKNGDPSDPCNYRGISLMNSLSKIFNAVIKNRLIKKFEDFMKPNQFGFTKNSRPSDAIFVLKTLINKYVHNKQKIYGCFVDLRKAFDSVWRIGLFYKLIMNKNIGYNLYNIIKQMYQKTECCVKDKFDLTNYTYLKEGLNKVTV